MERRGLLGGREMEVLIGERGMRGKERDAWLSEEWRGGRKGKEKKREKKQKGG